MPFTPPRCPLGTLAVFAFDRHRMNRCDWRPNPGFLPTAGKVPSVDVRLVWELRVLRGNGLDGIRSNRARTDPYNGSLQWGTVGLLLAHGRSSAFRALCPHWALTHRLLPNRKYEIGPMKLTKDTAAHRRLSPLIPSSGRLQMSTKAAISSAAWTVPESMMPRRCPVLSSLHRLFATTPLLRRFSCRG
jgi:hypothetical protein